ncbi:MAG: hypothetical protein ACK53K_02220 [Burkholderiales bacterium]|jgi:hypothetical protein
MSSLFPPLSRHHQLLHGLPQTVEQIGKGQIDQIPPGFLADYLALRWLTDRGHGLRLTPAGEALCQKLKQFSPNLAQRNPIGRLAG